MIVPFPTKTHNEHGVPVMNHTCPDCHQEYSITPYPRNPGEWLKCMGEHCTSYDPSRDCEWMFE